MRLEKWPLGKLKPNPDNPSTITEDAVKSLAAIIQAHGFRDPIEVRFEDGLVLAGHRRYLAAKHLKLSAVPVVVHEGMSDDEAKAYTIANNQASKSHEWNRALLSDHIASLPDHLAPDVLGFTPEDVAKLFDLDRGADEELSADGEDSDEPGPFLERGERYIIGAVTFQVYPNLNTEALRKAEELIPKLERLLKVKAILEGTELTFAEVISERAASAGM